MRQFAVRLSLTIILLFLCVFSNATTCMTAQEGFSRVCARSLSQACHQGEWSFDQESCLLPSDNLVPDILDIPWRTMSLDLSEREAYVTMRTLSEEILLKYDTRTIAKSLVARMYFLRELGKNQEVDQGQLKYSLYEDTKILMTVPIGVLGKIVKNGFLNIHQTGTSSAWNDESWRRRRESMFFRMKFPDGPRKIKAKSNELLPKYAYVVKKDINSVLRDTTLAAYSDTIVVFKDSVKKQATMTVADSLFGYGSVGLLDTQDSGHYLPPVTFFSLDHTNKSGRNEMTERGSAGYLEAQIWGELTMDDVDYIIVGCYRSPSLIQMKDLLKKIPPSISIYACSEAWSTSANQYLPGERIQRNL